MHEAILYDKKPEGKVRCRLCRHSCSILPGKTGICSVRENRDGVLYSLVYDKIAAAGVDPIEKKPLFHFYPGSLAYSVATMGCNFSCLHCQNSTLSQTPAACGSIEGRKLSPDDIVENAVRSNCRSISFTYSEPTIFAEISLDTARIAHDNGLVCSFVTNGYQSPEMVKEMTGLIDAANVDLKSFSASFYKKTCGAKLDRVLDTIRLLYEAGLWLEITTLLIPTMNDSDKEIKELARFIAGIDKNIPWHVSRYHPSHRMSGPPPTPPELLFKACEIGLGAGLRYIYTGNIPGRGGESTACPGCGSLLIERDGFLVSRNLLSKKACPGCGEKIAGVFDQ